MIAPIIGMKMSPTMESTILPNATPMITTQYQDKTFKFGEAYTYFVRAVSLGTEGRQVESLNSNSIEMFQEDKYAPAAPNLTTPNAAPGRIALFWTANSEPDVAGYLYAVVGVIYAVILAFVVIAVLEQSQDAQDAVDTEASAVLNLARMANGWPEDDRSSVQSSLTTYARQVVDVEWPAMARGDFGPASDTITVNQLFHALNEANDTAETKPSSYQVSLLQLDVADFRDDRVCAAGRQIGGLEGNPLLGEEVLGAVGERALARLARGVRGQHHDRHIGPRLDALVQGLKHLEAVHVVHLNVQQNHLWQQRPGGVQPLLP